MDANLFAEVQLLDLGEDENDTQLNVEDIELGRIDVSKCDKRNRLWLVLEEHRLEVLRQQNDSQVAGHCGRQRTQELVSRNFTCDRWSEDGANYVAVYI